MSGEPSARAMKIAAAVRKGDPAALGRTLSLVESGNPLGESVLAVLREQGGESRLVGVTGPPGAGKSTLVDALIADWRGRDMRVAILAVDPVSPRTGGAVLGDRARMGQHSLDEGVFIRSISARGHLGGLCARIREMIVALDAAAWDLIVLETVGAGQSETEVATIADCTVVVGAPGLGDELQAIKAGILETGDILVVNKADRSGAEETARHLAAMLKLRQGAAAHVPVMQVAAANGTGVVELARAIETHLDAAAPAIALRRAEARDRCAATPGLAVSDADHSALDDLFRRALGDADLARRLLDIWRATPDALRPVPDLDRRIAAGQLTD